MLHFNLVRRNLTLICSVFKTTSSHTPISFFSSSPPNSLNCSPNQEPFSVSYLINSCGFPPEKAISVSKYLTFTTPHRPDSVIQFLKDQGFTETQVLDLVQRFPTALQCHPQKNLLPKFDFLTSIGLSTNDIAVLFKTGPRLIGKSLKNRIEPSYYLLCDLLGSVDRALIAIKRCGWLLDIDLQKQMIPNMQLLQNAGTPPKMLYLLTHHPRHFLCPPADFKRTVEEVIEMGFDPSTTKFMLAIHALKSMSKPTWEKKVEVYRKWGWSEEEVCEAFRNNPWCMAASEVKINNVMDFLVNKMGFDKSMTIKHWYFISFSLEKRVVPRCLVYRYLLDQNLMDPNKRSFGINRCVRYPEIRFVNKLKSFEKDAPGILDFYRQKLAHAK